MISIASVVAALHRHFPVDPVPPYPPMMGMDPIGVDEYASFANVRWTEVPPTSYWHGYDISPPNGFSSFNPPYMWNYHLPGFIAYSLANDEGSVDALDSFMFFFNRCNPIAETSCGLGNPWWKSETFSGAYTQEQCQVVIDFLQLLKRSEGNQPLYYDWENSDSVTLAKWINRLHC